MDIKKIFERFQNTQLLVIGDLMVDAYTWGKVNRISPEAPVQIVNVTKKERRLGGAGNVVLNLLALGAKPILCSVVGNDQNGMDLKHDFEKKSLNTSGLILSNKRITTIKERIIADGQHLLRVDTEDVHPLLEDEEILLLRNIEHILDNAKIDVVIFEDYDKGCITKNVIDYTVELCNHKKIPTIVDPKKRNFCNYKYVTIFKPNLKELKEGLKLDETVQDPIETAKIGSKILVSKFGIQNTLVTLSENGVLTYDGKEYTHIKAHVREIADVSGAGDTVVSVAALCLAQNLKLNEIGILSNLAGGLVCEHVGVVPINKQDLYDEAIKIFKK
jgi:rfaE bifunctional protein kinase chain/domain